MEKIKYKNEQESRLKESINKGLQFLEKDNQYGLFPTYRTTSRDNINSKKTPDEIFTSIVIADSLPTHEQYKKIKQETLVYIKKQAGQKLINFFEDKSLIEPDTDVNALGYSVLLENKMCEPKIANNILNSILEYRDKKGRIQVWLSNNRDNRLDHVAATNAIYFAYLLDRQSETKPTENWVIQTLDSNEYINGSRYYHSPDSFLYFSSRLIKFPEFKNKLTDKLKSHTAKRIGSTKYSLDLSMRVNISNLLGIEDKTDMQKLLEIQESDGSWPADALYREGKNPIFYTNKSIPTALAIKAISSYKA